MYLFTEEDYNNAKFRDLLSCKCDVCEKEFLRTKREIYKAKQKGNKHTLCSKECQTILQTTKVLVTCKNCGKEFYKTKSEYERSISGNHFCSKSCSAIFSNKHRDESLWKENKKITVERLYKERTGFSSYIEKKKSEHICRICGQHTCVYPHICKSTFLNQKSSNLERFGFDFSKIGSFEVYDEYFKVQNVLYNLYYKEELSLLSIKNMYDIASPRTVSLLFNFFKIKRRTLSESGLLGYKMNRLSPGMGGMKWYKQGWHTSWDNRQHYYRSSYELDYMNELDFREVEYYTEKLRIQYFDSVDNIERTAIPDFYIPSTNTIVEVKSDYTYNRQNMIDKVKSYRELGYNFKLLYEHIMYDDCI